MKVHVVTNANRTLYRRQLEQMHRQRHQLFVEEMGWSDLASPDGLEIDQFDNGDAVYLLALDDGEVAGSMRLLPTWRRCMVTEVFPQFASEPVPVGPELWEWTRYCPGLMSKPRQLIRTRGALLTATLEFAASRGFRSYMAFGESKFMGQLVELGWSPAPLGMPRSFAPGSPTAMVMYWQIKPIDLANARRMFRLSAPVLVEAPAYTADVRTLIDIADVEALVPVDTHAARRQAPPAQPALSELQVQGRA